MYTVNVWRDSMAKKILVVEDSLMVQKLFKRALESHGFEVETSENGREALPLIENTQFDLIFTDLNMPFVNGIDFTKYVRKNANYQEVPVILVSSDSVSSRKTEAKEAGATGWITKPFSADKILAQVNHFLG